MAKKYGVLLLIGIGAGVFLLASGEKAHAKVLPPPPLPDDEEEDEEEPAAALPPPAPVPNMPPPQMPAQPDAVVIDKPGQPSEEVPIGDALLGDIEYEEPNKPPVVSTVPDIDEDEETPGEVFPAEEPDDDDDDDEDEDEEILQPEVIPPGGVIPPAPPVVLAPPVQPPPVVAPPAPVMPHEIANQPPAAQPVAPGNPEQKTILPSDTAALLAIMLSDEQGANWKRRVEELKPWQASRGLKNDGEFGTKSALKMAEETGLLPVVRFWPTGSYPEGSWLADYKSALRSLALRTPEPHSSQLIAASNRETGQGFGRGQQPIHPVIVF